MSPRPSLSVVMATFNGYRFIKEQLVSLSAQTLPPTELLVCDDGSDDATLSVVTSFARTAPFPIRIIRNPQRLGYANNFLHGASLCTGELIAFCDQDDVWHPTKLQRCVEVLQENSALLVIHNASVVDERLRPLGHSKPHFIRTETLPPRGCELTMTLPGFAMVFVADLLGGLAAYPRPVDPLQTTWPPLAHDQWIVFLARSAGHVVHLAENLAQYRQHAGNTCGAAPVSKAQKVALKHQNDFSHYLQRAEASRYFGDALAALAAVSQARHAGPWEKSAAHYRSLASSYLVRSQLYDASHTRLQHARHYVWLLAHRAYRSKLAGGLGWRAVLKDGASLLRTADSSASSRASATGHRAR